MATKEEAQALREKYGTPTEDALILDKEGNLITTVKKGSEEAKAVQAGKPLYKTAEGGWSATPNSYITLDKDSGKITITAPKEMTDREHFQQYKKTLENLSSYYKADKNTKIADPSDSSGETKISIEEMVNRISDGMPDLYKLYKATDAANEEAVKAGVDKLSEEQVIYMNQQTVDPNDEKGSSEINKNRLLIPEHESFNIYRQAESFNKSLGGVGSVTVEDANKLHSRENGKDGEDADARIVKQREVINEKIRNKDYTDTNDYIATQAMYYYLNNKSPETAWYRRLLDFGNNVILGLGAGAAKAGAGALMGSEAIVNKVTGKSPDEEFFGSNPPTTGKTGKTYQAYEGWKKTYDDLQFDIAEHNKKAEYLSPGANSAFEVSDFIGNLAAVMAMGFGLGKAIEAVGSYGALSASAGIARAGRAAQSAASKTAAGAETLTASLMASGEAEFITGLSAAELSGLTSMMSGGVAAYLGASAAITGAVTSGTFGIGTILSGLATTTATAAPRVATVTGLISDAMVSAVTMNPTLFVKAIEEDTNEGRQYMLEQLAWSFGGWAAFKTGGLALTKGMDTKIGQFVTALSATKMNWVQAKVGNLNQRIKTVVFNKTENQRIQNLQNALDNKGKPNVKKQQKGNTALQHQLIREQKEKIGKLSVLGPDLEKTWENVKKYQQEANELKVLYNELDRIQNGIRIQIALQAADSKELAAAREMRLTTTKKIIKAEKNVNLGDSAKAQYMADGTKIFKARTANYIGARLQLEPLKRQIDPKAYGISGKGLTGKRLEEAEKTLADLESKISQFKANASDDLISLADTYIDAYRKETQELMLWGINNGVVDAEEFANYLATQYWGKNAELYGMTRRKTEFNEYIIQRRDGKIKNKAEFEFEHRAPVATDDFVDPNLVITDLSMTLADAVNMKQATKGILATAGVKQAVKADGTKVSDTKRITELSKIYDNQIISNLSVVDETISANDAVEDIVSHMLNRDTKTAANLELGAALKNRVEERLGYATSASDVRRTSNQTMAVNCFGDDVVDEVLSEFGLSRISDQLFDDDSYRRLILSEESPLPPEVRSIIKDEVDKYAQQTDKKADRFSTYQEVVESNSGILQRADAAQIYTNPEAMASKTVRDNMENYYRDVYSSEYAQAIDSGKAESIAKALGLENGEQALLYIDETANSIVNALVDEATSNSVIEELIKRLKRFYGDEFSANAVEQEYLAIKAIKGKSKNVNAALDTSIDKQIDTYLEKNGIDIGATQKNAIKRELRDSVSNELDSRYNQLRQHLSDSNSKVVDMDEWAEEIRAANKEITGYSSEQNIVRTYDDQGRPMFIETDITVANMLNYKIAPNELRTFGQINYIWNKVFRFGTTGLRLASYVNQGFRDTMNAFVGGNMYRTIGSSIDGMAEFMGQEFVDEFKRLNPAEYKRISTAAQGDEMAIKREIAESEVGRGKAITQDITQTMAYRRSNTDADQWFYIDGSNRGGGWGKLEQKIDDATQIFMKPQDIREKYLRSNTYANAYAQAIKRGETVTQARASAEFAQSHATTNFGIPTLHLQHLRDSVPYIGAAINGTKSFYRLLALDPVGVMGRMFMGVGVPIMALTAMSLGTEENRKIWKNIPEYQKDENLVFIIDGDVVSIPIPQEMAALLNPFRHFIETQYNANRHAFTQLAVSDILGLSPISIDGFYNLDQSAILGNPTLWERMGAGTSRLFAQTAPPIVKSAYIWATGIDPLTGLNIDNTNVTYDPDTGQTLAMDKSAGALAKALNVVFGDNMSAPIAQKLLENCIGKGLTPVADLLAEGYSWLTTDSLTNPLDNFGKALTTDLLDPFTIEKRNTADLQWRAGVSQMWQAKNELMGSQAYKEVTNAINNATSLEEKRKHVAARNNMLEEQLFGKVKTMVEQYVNVYQGEFTPYKYGSLISLLNIEEANPTTSNVGQIVSQDLKQQGKAAAIETMYRMGFSEYQNTDLLGTVGTNADGSTYINWNTPLQILSAEKTLNIQDELITAGVQLLMKQGTDLEQEWYNSVKPQIDAIYDKKKLSNADYNKIDAIKVEWNARVMERIGPYIQQYGMVKTLQDRELINYLEKYIQVPTAYEVDKRGRSISSPNLNKQLGFAQKYIRTIFNNYDKRSKQEKN